MAHISRAGLMVMTAHLERVRGVDISSDDDEKVPNGGCLYELTCQIPNTNENSLDISVGNPSNGWIKSFLAYG